MGRGTWLRTGLTLILLVGILHGIFQFTFFGTGISGFYQTGISGFSIGKTEIGEEFKAAYRPISPVSKAFLIIEWGLLLIGLVFMFVRRKVEIKEELKGIDLPKRYKRAEKRTDLDVFYELLQEKKHLRLSTIRKIFGIDRDTAIGWAKILEAGSLAKLETPTMGEPEVSVREGK